MSEYTTADTHVLCHQIGILKRQIADTETKMSGIALLNDYKRLLFENENLKSRVATLEEERDDWRNNMRWN